MGTDSGSCGRAAAINFRAMSLAPCGRIFINQVPLFYAQIQPLSLEELLAKKKAEEEAEAKVRLGRLG